MRNIEWIYQKLDVTDLPINKYQCFPGQDMKENTQSLLSLMFHIGHQTFDQLLAGTLKIDYNAWFQTPMSLNTERAWLQVSQRYEFQDKIRLNVHDAVMVAYIIAQLK